MSWMIRGSWKKKNLNTCQNKMLFYHYWSNKHLNTLSNAVEFLPRFLLFSSCCNAFPVLCYQLMSVTAPVSQLAYKSRPGFVPRRHFHLCTDAEWHWAPPPPPPRCQPLTHEGQRQQINAIYSSPWCISWWAECVCETLDYDHDTLRRMSRPFKVLLVGGISGTDSLTATGGWCTHIRYSWNVF